MADKFLSHNVVQSDWQTVLTVPLRLINPLNQREHWKRVHARGVREKHATASAMLFVNRKSCVDAVHIDRVSPKRLDSDNLAASAKHVRDAVADALGRDDDDSKPGALKWSYGQIVGKEYGVVITLHHGGQP